MSYLCALSLTLLIEVPIYTTLLVRAGLFRPLPAALAGVAVNLVTHPVLWTTLRHTHRHYWPILAAAELLAWLAEALLLYAGARRCFPRLLLVSLAANAASLLAGLVQSVA